EVRQQRNHMTSSRSRVLYYQQVIIPLRHRIVEQTQLQFNGMLVGIFQLLQAKRDEIDAGRAFVEALHDYWLARIALESAVGGQLEMNQATTQPTTLGPTHHGEAP